MIVHQEIKNLVTEWGLRSNMLGHQLQALPPFEQFWDELPNIFNWLVRRKIYIQTKLIQFI